MMDPTLHAALKTMQYFLVSLICFQAMFSPLVWMNHAIRPHLAGLFPHEIVYHILNIDIYKRAR